MGNFNEITPKQLVARLGRPDMPRLLDLRIDEDFAADPHLIPTASRLPYQRVAQLAWEGRPIVVICQKGRKISQGAAALLRARGIEAEVLTGGSDAWREAGLPRITAARLPTSSLWVTRHRPKIDRIACPWLIRRFIDPQAQFLFVPPMDVALVAERFKATPFDCDSGPFSHQGASCSFDAFLYEFGLDTEPLHRLAKLVRAADTNSHALAPEAPGLLAVSVGLSRAFRDDQAQLEAGMTLYDALYLWARDGQSERHDR